jgi:septum formation topological specificity factor MinE
MFAQGGLCFFCKKPLPKSEASVEHLLASSNGGSNSDENCVACCKAVNALLGSMSLKEKVQVVLNQKGQFKCPNDICSAKVATPPKASPKTPSAASSKEERIKLVVANLKQRGNAKPRTLKTLKSSLATLFHKGLSEGEMADLVQQLQSLGKITVSEDKVTYAL